MEFISKLSVQFLDAIERAGNNIIKKPAVLIKALPVNVIADLQRRLKNF